MRPLTELKDILDSQGRSQAWLNREMEPDRTKGWSYSNVTKALNGTWIPHEKRIVQMCEILGVDPAPYLRK
jgi:hypothetical protein